MEVIGIVLLIFVVNAVVGTLKKAGTRRAPAHLPRRQLQDVLNQMMEQAGQGGIDQEQPIESVFVGESMAPYELAPSYAPFGGLDEGGSRLDEPGCVGGSMAHELHEGMEFPGHIHQSAVRDDAPMSDPEPADVHSRLTGRQMRRALVMAEVLDRPVSVRKGGGYR